MNGAPAPRSGTPPDGNTFGYGPLSPVAINRALVSQAAKERLGGSGYELVGGTSEQFTAHVKKEIAKWADVVKRTGAKVD